MNGLPEKLVKTRCVISIGDYEPIDVEQQFTNFQRGLQRFGKTWNVDARYSKLKMEADGAVAVWNIETKASNWQVKTEFRLLNWTDIVKKDFRRWNLDRVWLALRAITNFIFSGTCWRYLRLNWRFGVYFLYPALAVFLFAIVALWLSALLGNLEVSYAGLLGFAIGIGLFAAFVKWVDPIGVPRVMDMWVFMYELVHLERTNLAERLGVFSQDIIAQLQSDDFDEVLIIGHGIGAVLQPIIVDRAFWALPEFGKDGRSVSLLSIGSLLLAVGLHPEGGWVVGPVSRVARDRWVKWAEYQTEKGVIGFPGINPVTELISDHHKPVLQNIKISGMTDAMSHFSKSIYQNHRQLVRANSKRYFYDYFMTFCGPFTLSMRMEHPELMVEAFHPDGRLIVGP